MEENNRDQSRQPTWLTEWLEHLQRESWQLELIISGFAIILLIQGLEAGDQLYEYIMLHISPGNPLEGILFLGVITLGGASVILLTNLTIHLVLRGLWIGTLGLRSISQTIDYEQLRYSNRFKSYLKHKVGSYDEYIMRLERISSVVFVFSFLIVFVLVGAILCVTTFALIPQFFNVLGIVRWIRLGFLMIMAATLLMYFVDFVTFGGLKRIRNRYFTALYLPIYKFWSFVTLAFLYRPILYNMLDNSYGKRVAWLTLPYIFLLLFVMTIQLDGYPLLQGLDGINTYQDGGYLNADFYDDQREDKFIKIFSIPSRSVSASHLEVFLGYDTDDNLYLAKVCSGYIDSSHSVFTNGIIRGISEVSSTDTSSVNSQDRADCIREMYKVQLDDSLIHKLNQKVYIHPQNKERGVLCFIDIATLPRGMHELTVTKKTLPARADSVQLVTHSIPFWRD